MACFQHLCNVLPQSSPAQTCLTFTRCRVSSYISSHLRDIACRLLQCHSHWGAQVSPTSCSEYWMPLLALSVRFASTTTACSICTRNCTSVCSPELHSTWWNAAFRSPPLPVGSICGQPAATSCYTWSPAFDVWSSGLLCGWPHGLELVTWHCSWSDMFVWQFLVWFKKTFFSVYSALDALWLCTI